MQSKALAETGAGPIYTLFTGLAVSIHECPRSTAPHRACCGSIDVLDLDQGTVRSNSLDERAIEHEMFPLMTLRATILINTVLISALFALLQPASALQIKRLRFEGGTFLLLRGEVRPGDYGRLNTMLQGNAVSGLEIRSGGGSLEDGIQIARVVRDRGLPVYVSKECDSVCAFILFAAKERYMGRRCKIGVHSISNQHGKENAETAQSTVKLSRLLTRFAVPHSVIGKIVATPPAQITFLDDREITVLNVQRRNPFRSKGPSAPVDRPSSDCQVQGSCAVANSDSEATERTN